MKGIQIVKLLEPIGLFLLLTSVFWRVFLVDEVKKINEAVWKAKVETKIDDLFMIVRQHYRSDYPAVSTRGSATNLDAIEDGWVYTGHGDSGDPHTKTFVRIQEGLFIVGSLLIFASKLLPILRGA